MRRDKFDHVVIETTGLANPKPIIETFRAFPVRMPLYPAVPAVPAPYSMLLTSKMHYRVLEVIWISITLGCRASLQSDGKRVLRGSQCSAWACMQPVAEHYSLDGVLTLVDAKHVEQHLDEEKEEGVVNEAIAQVAYADRIILNKTDLVSATFIPAESASSERCSSYWLFIYQPGGHVRDGPSLQTPTMVTGGALGPWPRGALAC